MSLPQSSRRAATLIELMVAITIVAILSSLLLVSVRKAQEAAYRVECMNNLRQLALQVHQYHENHRKLPAYATGKDGEIYGNWYVPLLPYAEQGPLYEKIRTQSDWRSSSGMRILSPAHAIAGKTNFPALQCPSDPTPGSAAGKTNYVANWYVWGDADKRGPYSPAQRFESNHDGLSSSVLFAESYMICDGLVRSALVSRYSHNFGITQQGWASDDPKYLPNDYTMFQVQPSRCDKQRTQTPHSSMHVALADGSVRSVDPQISLATWKSLLKPRDGAAPRSDW